MATTRSRFFVLLFGLFAFVAIGYAAPPAPPLPQGIEKADLQDLQTVADATQTSFEAVQAYQLTGLPLSSAHSLPAVDVSTIEADWPSAAQGVNYPILSEQAATAPTSEQAKHRYRQRPENGAAYLLRQYDPPNTTSKKAGALGRSWQKGAG